MYTPKRQPRPISAAASRRLHERRDAEARRDALHAEATDLLMPYAVSGTPVPDDVKELVAEKQAAARAIEIPDYL